MKTWSSSLTTLSKFMFFYLFNVSCNIITCFVIVPYSHKILVKSFFYFLRTNLEGTKTVINYSRLSVFKTDVVCGFFSTYVQSYIILQSQKKNVRLAKDAPVTQTLFFLKEAALFNVFLILLNIEKIKITSFAVSHCWSIFFHVLFENSWFNI